MLVGITIDCAADTMLDLVRDHRLAWHLAEAMRYVPGVERAVLINLHSDRQYGSADVITVRDALVVCDLIIAAGDQLDMAAISQFRARGGRYVLYCSGDPYTAIVEHSIFDKAALFGPVGCHDAVWIDDAAQAQAAFLATVYRCPVRGVPFVWSPSFLAMHNRVHSDDAFRFAWARSADFCGPWACVINASNATVGDMGVMALVAANRFHVSQPGALSRVEFRNGTRIGNQLTFNYLAASLEVQAEQRLTIWAEQDYYGLLPLRGDFVLSHRPSGMVSHDQLDTLHAGYPIVHNCDALADFGYYYPGNDIDQAVAMMMTMAKGHDPDLSGIYRLMARFAPGRVEAVNAFAAATGAA